MRQDITFNERKSSDTEEIVRASQTEDLMPDQSPENAEAATMEETKLLNKNLEPQAADNPGAEFGEEEGSVRIDSPPPVIPRSSSWTTICHDYAKLNSHGFAWIAKGIFNEPTLKEALADSEATWWINEMQEELSSLEENETWDLLPAPGYQKVLSGKWVLKKKPHPDNTIRYKARWMVRG